MFPLQDSFGNVLTTEYAEQRMKWEPVVEMTQIKGDSETHPQLSPTDEFADYETYDHLIAVEGAESQFVFSDGFLGELTSEQREYLDSNMERVAKAGDYARAALIRGLVVEAAIGANPYKFGMIGSTDSHTAMSSAEEDNFHGKMALDSTPESKSAEIIPGTPGWDMGAAGLVGVWAEENTRLRSSTRCSERRYTPPRVRGSSCASSAAGPSSRETNWKPRSPESDTRRACPWAET